MRSCFRAAGVGLVTRSAVTGFARSVPDYEPFPTRISLQFWLADCGACDRAGDVVDAGSGDREVCGLRCDDWA